MNETRMNVLLQSDDRYAAVTGVCLCSLLENNRGAQELHIYLIDESIGEENRNKLRALAAHYGRSLDFLDMSALSARLAAEGAPRWLGSYAAYGRLFAPGMIEEEIDRLLYLDSDTLVTADLGELYNMDMEGKVCAMVQDTAAYRFYRYLGHCPDEPYFNSGVILFDVAQWKRLDCEAAVFPFLRAFGTQPIFPDQDALNYILRGKIKKLSPRYNFFVPLLTSGLDTAYYAYALDKKPGYYSREEMREAGQNAAIYHYSSVVKPWIVGTRCARTALWEHYWQLSPWAGQQRRRKREQPLWTRMQTALYERGGAHLLRAAHLLSVYALAPLTRQQRKRRSK